MVSAFCILINLCFKYEDLMCCLSFHIQMSNLSGIDYVGNKK